ncbi:hypothetical protein DB88DRAFT_548703 [Papiliotrema laurentii]|uniref:DUF6534 domain-containing protein n=1 Tax=Papiliotrema laurentii TaxID=5418 RepID=A0AAD9FIT3_PAPLA|nr:hypothetical protein DB88DRAFT_548703 [Papiliotrema laurentii]
MSSVEASIEAQAKAVISADPGASLGALLLAWMFDFGLFGIIAGQFFFWLSTSRADRVFVKVVVYWVTAFSAGVTVWGIYLFFYHFGLNFGRYASFTRLDRLIWYTILDELVTIPVLIFYMERAYRLHKNSIWIPLVVTPFMMLSVAGSIGSLVHSRNPPSSPTVTPADIASFERLFQVWMNLWLGGLLAADLLVTSLILWGLSKNRSGWSTTDRLIHRLIWMTVEAQFPGTIIAAVNVCLTNSLKSSALNTFFQIVHPKFYTLSLLAVLNSRVALRREADTTQMYASKTRGPTGGTSETDGRYHRTVDTHGAGDVESRADLSYQLDELRHTSDGDAVKE